MSIPATPTKVKNVWVLSLKFNIGKLLKSFSERYIVDVAEDLPSPPVAHANANPNVTDLINFRRVLLGTGVEMYSASISTTTGGTDAKPLLFQPGGPVALNAENPVADANLGGDGLQFMCLSGARKRALRPCLGVRDTWITGNTLTVDISAWDPAAYVLPGAHTGQTAAEAIQSWMKLLLTKTMRASYANGVYTVEAWNNVQYRRACSRSLGAIFGGRPSKRRV